MPRARSAGSPRPGRWAFVGVQHRRRCSSSGTRYMNGASSRAACPGCLPRTRRDVHAGPRGDQTGARCPAEVVPRRTQGGFACTQRPVPVQTSGSPRRLQARPKLPTHSGPSSRRLVLGTPSAEGAGMPEQPAVSAPCPSTARRSGSARRSRTRPGPAQHRVIGMGVELLQVEDCARDACPALRPDLPRRNTGSADSSDTGCR